jgi:superfamily II DNA or RNA helicase
MAHGGGYVAFPTGTGKTHTACAALAQWGGATLIVCPAKVVPQWVKARDLWGLDADVTSFQKLKRLAMRRFTSLVIDEAHNVKNRKAAVTGMVQALNRAVKHTILLSATPSPNRPADLWVPLKMLHGNRVPGWTEYCEKWCECTYWDQIVIPGKVKREERENFKLWVRGLLILQNSRALDLPQVKLGLLQEPPTDPSPKLYFTWERAAAERYAQQLGCDYIHGGQSVALRHKRIEKARDQARSLVCTVDSVGEGVDGLQFYKECIFLQLVWTPGKLVQAMGRIVRIGSPFSEVNISFLAPKGSRAERMAYLLKQKLIDFAAIFGDEDAERVAQDILGGEMTDAQFDEMAANLEVNLLDFGL